MAVSFKGAHVPKGIILMGVRWYVAYPLGTCHVEELMEEHGVEVGQLVRGRDAYRGQRPVVLPLVPARMSDAGLLGTALDVITHGGLLWRTLSAAILRLVFHK
jgi:hypothetical protein